MELPFHTHATPVAPFDSCPRKSSRERARGVHSLSKRIGKRAGLTGRLRGFIAKTHDFIGKREC
jgi:hypothetical protein